MQYISFLLVDNALNAFIMIESVFLTIPLTPIKTFFYFFYPFENSSHFGHFCQKLPPFLKEKVKSKNTFIGVKWIVCTWGKQFLALITHVKHFKQNQMWYTASDQKILKILCIFNENKLYPGLIKGR
jgi:hypothetical protein